MAIFFHFQAINCNTHIYQQDRMGNFLQVSRFITQKRPKYTKQFKTEPAVSGKSLQIRQINPRDLGQAKFCRRGGKLKAGPQKIGATQIRAPLPGNRTGAFIPEASLELSATGLTEQ